MLQIKETAAANLSNISKTNEKKTIIEKKFSKFQKRKKK